MRKPRSTPHTSGLRVQASSGFTLLEILVVVVIVGIIVASATLAVGVLGRDRELEDEARRITAIIDQSREEAELQGKDIGVRFAQPSYEFLQFDARREYWKPIEGDSLFKTRELPEGVRARLWLDGREVVLKPKLEPYEEDKRDKLQPQLLVLSSGDLSPFELRLEREGTPNQWRIIGAADNTVKAEPVDAQTRK